MTYWHLLTLSCIALSAFVAGQCYEAGHRKIGFINLMASLINIAIVARHII